MKMNGQPILLKEALHRWTQQEYDQASQLLRQSLDEDSLSKTAIANNLAVSEPSTPEETLKSLRDEYERLMFEEKLTVSENKKPQNQKLDQEASVLLYNMAVIKYQQRLYGEVITILKPLFSIVDTLHDGLKDGIAFLLLEASLAAGTFTEVSTALNTVERTVCLKENTSPLVMKDWSKILLNNVDQSLPSSSASPKNHLNFGPDFKINLKPFDFPMISKPDLMNTKDSFGIVPDGLSVSELKIRNAFYAARILLSLRRYHQVHEVLQAVQKECGEELLIDLVLLEAQTCFAENNLQRALEILTRTYHQIPEDNCILRNYTLNNMGVVYQSMKKRNLSSFCFMASISNYNKKDGKNESKENYIISLYNIGLVTLQNGKFTEALALFKEASQLLFNKPYLWLRMAECCIGISKENNADECLKIKKIAKSEKHLPTVFILPEGPNKNLNQSSHPEGQWLSTAYRYLQNSLALLGKFPDVVPPNGLETGLYVAIKSNEKNILEGEIYLRLGYITLNLNQPERCLHFIKRLKTVSSLEEETLLLGSLYEIEALCLLDNTRDAINILKPYVDSIDMKGWNYENSKDQKTIPGLQWTMYQDLASIYCANKDFPKALMCAQKALKFKPHASQTWLLVVYIELVSGNTKKALDIIHSQYF